MVESGHELFLPGALSLLRLPQRLFRRGTTATRTRLALARGIAQRADRFVSRVPTLPCCVDSKKQSGGWRGSSPPGNTFGRNRLVTPASFRRKGCASRSEATSRVGQTTRLHRPVSVGAGDNAEHESSQLDCFAPASHIRFHPFGDGLWRLHAPGSVEENPSR